MFTHTTYANVMILDQDFDDRQFLQEAFLHVASGVQLTSLAHARELFPAVQAQRVDLIIMEAHLLTGSSLECIRQLKAHPLYRNIPIILWSTSCTEPLVTKAYAAGLELFIEKPWSISQLEEIIVGILDRYLEPQLQRA
ncbi:response regulator [Paraflavisolibacter sp. H34]|uniref:response regulator n=1 Tax=Huijunlia imazamoxiresistens TaxID=3127457 RepID=UPI003019EC7A